MSRLHRVHASISPTAGSTYEPTSLSTYRPVIVGCKCSSLFSRYGPRSCRDLDPGSDHANDVSGRPTKPFQYAARKCQAQPRNPPSFTEYPASHARQHVFKCSSLQLLKDFKMSMHELPSNLSIWNHWISNRLIPDHRHLKLVSRAHFKPRRISVRA